MAEMKGTHSETLGKVYETTMFAPDISFPPESVSVPLISTLNPTKLEEAWVKIEIVVCTGALIAMRFHADAFRPSVLVTVSVTL